MGPDPVPVPVPVPVSGSHSAFIFHFLGSLPFFTFKPAIAKSQPSPSSFSVLIVVEHPLSQDPVVPIILPLLGSTLISKLQVHPAPDTSSKVKVSGAA